MSKAAEAGYLVSRDELLNLPERKLLTNDRDYVFFALQIDLPGKLNSTVDVTAFCDCGELSPNVFVLPQRERFRPTRGDLKLTIAASKRWTVLPYAPYDSCWSNKDPTR